eukprot:TRINITY_DN1023_c0_g1_i1.p1 TRINITY_DN1023_c0_g1~~TRINITY_DN1023_c0_g1_i1.p1  ORF type:complete len:449 (+),score=173.03 TRINITY_DN1023_c0_g1_i1:44-1390(+)
MSNKKNYDSKDIGSCRFYENKYPDLDDLVMVKVKTIESAAVYVQLLEYNNVDGMIPMTEVSRRRIRSIGKHLRIGKMEVVQVFRVDKEKGYIDLSKKKVTPDDIRKCEERYQKNKQIHSIMMHVAKQCTCIASLEELYQKVTWPLAKAYGSSFEAFKLAYATPEKVLDPLDLEPEIKDLLIKDITEKLKVPRYRIRADIEVSCYTEAGVDAVKSVLLAGQAMGTEETPLKITLVAPPIYVLRVSSLDREAGFNLINDAITKMTALIREEGGSLKVDRPPRVVSEEEKKETDSDEEEEEEEEEIEQKKIYYPSQSCPSIVYTKSSGGDSAHATLSVIHVSHKARTTESSSPAPDATEFAPYEATLKASYTRLRTKGVLPATHPAALWVRSLTVRHRRHKTTGGLSYHFTFKVKNQLKKQELGELAKQFKRDLSRDDRKVITVRVVGSKG